MNILAPVNTIESAKILIEAGADEIYLGADESVFNTFSFTGRGKVSCGGLKVLPSYSELEQIVKYAHSQNIRVNYIANSQFFYNGLYNGDYIEKEYFKYLEKGLAANVDSIVIGDIGLLNSVCKQNYSVDIHASVYFKTLNQYQLQFLKECGVTRTCLSYHITMNEIIELTQKNIMEIEVVGYLGCSFFNGACGFLHELGEGILNDFNPGVTCKNIFSAQFGEEYINVSFDVEAGCSMCSLGKLEDIGVKAVKIVGRDRNIEQMKEVVMLYRKVLDNCRKKTNEEILATIIPEWWKKVWCTKMKCKYRDNPYSCYLVGD